MPVFCRLCLARTWWMDGTFATTPSIFAQLYVIHIKLNDEFFPQLWCLLPDKQNATYARLIQGLKRQAALLNLQIQPAIIHVDFEMAMIQAIRTEFAIEPNGCLFHFAQSLLRHLQQTGLQVSYNTNTPPEVRTWIRRLIALPLVPPLRIDQAFQAATATAPNVPGRDAMTNYVMNTYVDPNAALFHRDTWNCFGLRDRTINACEGYHSMISSCFKRGHADPYAFFYFFSSRNPKLSAE